MTTEQELWGNALFDALKAAGVVVAPDASDPALGWFFTSPVGQVGPFDTAEAALTGGLRDLIARVVAAEGAPPSGSVALE
jgi:hypothetical protein